MYCILVTGIPATGKSTIAEALAQRLNIPMISKDAIKELLFDEIGFQSRQEKVRLGIAAMKGMYYFAEQLMKRNQPFLLENNFENVSKEDLMRLLNAYDYQAVTVTLTGDYTTVYQRFAERDKSPTRHRGHVVNDCYPEREHHGAPTTIPYEWFVAGIRDRGMDSFTANGPRIVVDTTDFAEVNAEEIAGRLMEIIHTLR